MWLYQHNTSIVSIDEYPKIIKAIENEIEKNEGEHK